MSKKSRKRNKKILSLLAAGLGAAALMKGKGTAQGVSGADKAKFTSDAAYTAPVTGTDYPGANKAVTAPVKASTWISPRMRGHGAHSGDVGQKIRAGLSQPTTTAVAPPSILNPYRTQRIGSGPRRFSKGGRVKGGGKAKRGLGRAFTKAKK